MTVACWRRRSPRRARAGNPVEASASAIPASIAVSCSSSPPTRSARTETSTSVTEPARADVDRAGVDRVAVERAGPPCAGVARTDAEAPPREDARDTSAAAGRLDNRTRSSAARAPRAAVRCSSSSSSSEVMAPPSGRSPYIPMNRRAESMVFSSSRHSAHRGSSRNVATSVWLPHQTQAPGVHLRATGALGETGASGSSTGVVVIVDEVLEPEFRSSITWIHRSASALPRSLGTGCRLSVFACTVTNVMTRHGLGGPAMGVRPDIG